MPNASIQTQAASVSVPRSQRSAATKQRGYGFVLPALLFIALMTVYPLTYNLWLAVHGTKMGNLLRGSSPFVGLDNFYALGADPAFRHALPVSLIFTAGSLFLQFTLGFALALFFSANRFPEIARYAPCCCLVGYCPSWSLRMSGAGSWTEATVFSMRFFGRPGFFISPHFG